ncbi:MAG: hypothetical protein IPN47_22440 [Gemmatimonadetes bacterium]|nr:hypothetical protein [Gemmatimonadota bacterium]
MPTGAKVVDVSGKHIYPGLVDAYSTVGITEIGAVDVSNDINELRRLQPERARRSRGERRAGTSAPLAPPACSSPSARRRAG